MPESTSEPVELLEYSDDYLDDEVFHQFYVFCELPLTPKEVWESLSLNARKGIVQRVRADQSQSEG